MKYAIIILPLLLIANLVLAQPRNIPPYVPKCGLVAWYAFSGNAIDSSGSRHNGVVNGAILTKDRYGFPNSAYYFNGSSYIMIPPDSANRDTTMDIDGSISVSVWIKSTDYSRSQEQIFWRGDAASGYDPCSVYVDGYSLGFRRDVGSSSTSEIISHSISGLDTLFHHVVATFDSVSGYMNIYFDGKLVTSALAPGTATYPTTAFWNTIGSVDYGTWQYFLGTIDDLGVWNRCLTPCEVSNLYFSKNICNCFGDTIGTVTPPPPDSLYITGVDTGCRTLRFTASSKDTSVISYNWDFGDGATGTGNPVYHTYISGGTYTVSVTTTNRKGEKSTAYYTAVIAQSSIHGAGDTTICVGASARLNVTGGTNYSWSPSTSLNDASIPNPVATPNITTTYLVTGTDNKGCPAGDSVKVTVVPLPNVKAQVNTKFQNCETHGIQLMASGAKNYVWSPGKYCDDSTSSTPIIYLGNDATVFYLTGTDIYGCADTTSLKIDPHGAAIVSLPSAFSPNGDGANDVLYIRGANVSAIDFVVYNRWGQRVFETNDIKKGWDGTFNGAPQPIESYVYVIKIKSLDGCEIIKKGSITLLR